LAEQAKILFEEAEENNLIGTKRFYEKWARWFTCSLCEQKYHGVVRCALGWACWKTYLGRPETDMARGMAMNLLGNGLTYADLHEDALTVKEAELSTLRRLGADEDELLVVQGNLANTYQLLHRYDEALPMRREVYSGFVQLYGEEHGESLREAFNYVTLLNVLNSFEEAKSLMRKTIPKARRIFGENGIDTLKMRVVYAQLLYKDDGGTLDDLREAVTMLEGTERTARRVLGGTHPLVVDTERSLRDARATLRARETPPGS
jgi:hypothetical protein